MQLTDLDALECIVSCNFCHAEVVPPSAPLTTPENAACVETLALYKSRYIHIRDLLIGQAT